MMNKTTIPCLLVLLMLSAGCVKLGSEPLDKQFYRLMPERSAETAHVKRDLILKVRRLSISEIYNTRELVYQLDNGRVESDFYNMFFVSPRSMLTTELRSWLKEADIFASIIEPGSMIIPGLTLEGVVNSLYGDYATSEPVAVVAMQFFLVDENTPDNTIVFSKDYTQRVPLTEPTPEKLVQGMTTGVQLIFEELEKDLAQTPLQ
ncbi:MAG: hypothetical protein CL942_04760 [Desulfovibrio sp.]|nr:hypothetical protein [Desulfovibrio sp.]|tara:strand:- start:1319 stop:1933 length:615 start_codon:yes stop_codon:yes gene_type:complete